FRFRGRSRTARADGPAGSGRRLVAARRDAETAHEPAGEVALVGEPGQGGGLGGGVPEVVGLPYRDGSGNEYLPMIRRPVPVYTEELFKTSDDEDNRAAVAAVPADELRLAGICVSGPRNAVDKALKGLPLHP